LQPLAPVVVDLEGRVREFVNDFESLRITPRLNGYASVDLEGVDPLSQAARQLLVAERALKVYDVATMDLRFHGKVWEPLSRKPDGVTVTARDPFAELAWRRVRDPATAAYAAVDFGDVLIDRVAKQNALRATCLRALTANRQLSTATTRGWGAGKREDEIFDEVVSADGSPFFRVAPVDGVPGVMGDLKILYPNAGATREGVRFEYGEGTLDNAVDYEIVYRLPLNRFTASTAEANGGRLARPFEDAASVARYGLFEDETTYSESTATALLDAQARAEVRADPAYSIVLQPGLDAPLLFRDFDVGDFVRVRILYGADDVFTWARVTEATLLVDKDGAQRTASIVVDVLTGAANVTTAPEDLFRADLDEGRRRLEALERRVQNLTVTGTEASVAPGAAGAGSIDPSSDAPPEPPAPPPPPPASAPPGPTVSGVSSGAISTTALVVGADVDGRGSGTSSYAAAIRQSDGVVVRISDRQDVGTGSRRVSFELSGLARNTTYTLRVFAESSAGSDSDETTATTPNVGFE
jgi:hypothetical protein